MTVRLVPLSTSLFSGIIISLDPFSLYCLGTVAVFWIFGPGPGSGSGSRSDPDPLQCRIHGHIVFYYRSRIAISQFVWHRPEHNRVTWKTPSSEAFVPLQEQVGVLASYVPHTQMQV